MSNKLSNEELLALSDLGNIDVSDDVADALSTEISIPAGAIFQGQILGESLGVTKDGKLQYILTVHPFANENKPDSVIRAVRLQDRLDVVKPEALQAKATEVLAAAQKALDKWARTLIVCEYESKTHKGAPVHAVYDKEGKKYMLDGKEVDKVSAQKLWGAVRVWALRCSAEIINEKRRLLADDERDYGGLLNETVFWAAVEYNENAAGDVFANMRNMSVAKPKLGTFFTK